jgi:hypothetical protein
VFQAGFKPAVQCTGAQGPRLRQSLATRLARGHPGLPVVGYIGLYGHGERTGLCQGSPGRAVPDCFEAVDAGRCGRKDEKGSWGDRANDPPTSPVCGNPAVPGRGPLSPTRPPEAIRATSWTRPTRAVRRNQPPGARPPGQRAEPGRRLCLQRQRAFPPKTRWVNPPPPRVNKPRLAAGRQLSYAEVGKAYAGVVAGRPVKQANVGVDSVAPLPSKLRPHKRVKEGGMKEPPANLPSCPCPPEDVRVDNTAGGHLAAHPAEPNKPSGTLEPTTKCSGTAAVPAASMEAAPRRTSPGTSGPLSVKPKGATVWKTALPPGSNVTKSRCTYRGWEKRRTSSNEFARSPQASFWRRWNETS